MSSINFIPPHKPTQSEIQLHTLRQEVTNLPNLDFEEVELVMQRVRFLVAKYGERAVAGATIALLEYAVSQGK